jgi:hypothetical protein
VQSGAETAPAESTLGSARYRVYVAPATLEERFFELASAPDEPAASVPRIPA